MELTIAKHHELSLTLINYHEPFLTHESSLFTIMNRSQPSSTVESDDRDVRSRWLSIQAKFSKGVALMRLSLAQIDLQRGASKGGV